MAWIDRRSINRPPFTQRPLTQGSAFPPDAATRQRWLGRYRAAVRRLRDAGITTFPDGESGFRIYAALRSQWEPDANRLAQAMLYDPAELDLAGTRPQDTTDERSDFYARLHSVG